MKKSDPCMAINCYQATAKDLILKKCSLQTVKGPPHAINHQVGMNRRNSARDKLHE